MRISRIKDPRRWKDGNLSPDWMGAASVQTHRVRKIRGNYWAGRMGRHQCIPRSLHAIATNRSSVQRVNRKTNKSNSALYIRHSGSLLMGGLQPEWDAEASREIDKSSQPLETLVDRCL